MKSTIEKDAVADAISKALRAAKSAEEQANEDTRTNGTECADFVTRAVNYLLLATQWMAELRDEERRDRRVKPPAPAKPAPKRECHMCGEEIEPDDLAICGGCDKPTCPECMGDEGYCKECEADAAG